MSMTRKEEIINAAEQYAAHLVDTDVTDFYGKYEQKMDFVLDEYNAFLAGAKFADEHPKSPWVNVENDLPCNHKDLLENEHYTKYVLAVLEWNDDSSKKHIEVCDMCNKIGSFNVDFYWRKNGYYTVTHWMKLPELPK